MTTPAITSFSGRYRFLSNFYQNRITIGGREYATVEHYFQASRLTTEALHERVRTMSTAVQAKKVAHAYRKTYQRPDWQQVKEDFMLYALQVKFQNPNLRDQLIMTGDAQLVEGNTWKDDYWGVYNGHGLNRLGVLLMQVREELR